jgi:hypothetical protein
MSASTEDANPGRHPKPLSTKSHGSKYSALQQEESGAEDAVSKLQDSVLNEKEEEPVTWKSLPHRRQLIILTLSRLSEPLVQTSLQVCDIYLLKTDPNSNRHDTRRICFTNSNPLTKASRTR